MVKDTGAPGSADALRALSLPVPLQVKADGHGLPTAVQLKRRWLRVESVADMWRIDDEWWRSDPVSRLYYQCLVDRGLRVTVFHVVRLGVRWQAFHPGPCAAYTSAPAQAPRGPRFSEN